VQKQLEVLYEDETCLVFNKPAGLAVQGGKGVPVSLDSILASVYSPRPLLVHRLDKDTSGIILVAKTKADAGRFSSLMRKGIIKRYLAICAGRPGLDRGVIRLDIETHRRMQKSETRYKVLESLSYSQDGLEASHDTPAGGNGLCPMQFSLLELELGTGRMHQIRRHLAMTGTPVLGDDKYGDFALNKALRKTLNLRQLLLHAHTLSIPSCPGNQSLTLKAPLPDYFRIFLEKNSFLYR
jgi:23S rRNA pseudouridine955/2504/2580 synthase